MKIWNLGKNYSEELCSVFKVNKYIELSKTLPNYRYLLIRDLIDNPDIMNSLPNYVVSFVKKEGCVLMIANLIEGECVSILFRSLTSKIFLDYGASKGVLYGVGDLAENFKYGHPILVVEGPADRDALLDIFPNIVATRTSAISVMQLELLSSLTNRIILLLDNDDAGRKGTSLSINRLKSKKMKFISINHYPRMKDSGMLIEMKLAGISIEDAEAFYLSQLKVAVSCLK